MRLAASVVAAFAALFALAGPARAFTLEFQGFEPTGDQFYGCGLEINGSDVLVVVDPPELPGLGVFGGGSDLLIDGNESVEFEFLNAPATNVRYTVSEIVASGGATIDAYDEQLDLIGTEEVSGAGEKDVSALFGFVPLRSFRVTNAIGGHRIGSVSFQPNGGITVDMRDAPDTQTPSLQHCGVGVGSDGTGDLYVSPVTGIGVGGASAGSLDYFVEPGESLVVELDERAYDLHYSPSSSGGSDPVVEVTAFGADGSSLGTVLAVETVGFVDVSGLFLGAPLLGFQLTPLEGDLSLREITFVPESGAAAGAIAAAAALAALRARRA